MKILIIDNNLLFREGLCNLLQQEPGIVVVGGAGTVSEAVDIVKIHQPDLALLDADLALMEDYQGIRLLRAERANMQVVLLTTNRSEEQLINAVRNGARGYLSKNGSLSTVLVSIQAIERGEAVIPRAMVGALLDEFYRLTPLPNQDGVDLLTPRELGVLAELGQGKSNRQISENLGIAENTVKVHVHNILEKLNLHTRRQAARFARAHFAAPDVENSFFDPIGSVAPAV